MTLNIMTMSRDYYTAAICRRGHVVTSCVELRKDEVAPRCEECGATVLLTCPSCGAPIKGASTHYTSSYDPPQFCIYCGYPMPWSSRQARLYELENKLSEQEGLSDADRLTIQEQIQELNRPDLSDEQQAKHWKLIKKASPTLIEVGRELVVSVTSEVIQKQLGIK